MTSSFPSYNHLRNHEFYWSKKHIHAHGATSSIVVPSMHESTSDGREALNRARYCRADYQFFHSRFGRRDTDYRTTSKLRCPFHSSTSTITTTIAQLKAGTLENCIISTPQSRPVNARTFASTQFNRVAQLCRLQHTTRLVIDKRFKVSME